MLNINQKLFYNTMSSTSYKEGKAAVDELSEDQKNFAFIPLNITDIISKQYKAKIDIIDDRFNVIFYIK